MPRDTDEEALRAFKDAFEGIAVTRNKDAKIRLGKAQLALEQVEKALAWAQKCDFTQTELAKYQLVNRKLCEEAKRLAKQPNPDMKELEKLKENCRKLCDLLQRNRQKKKITDLPQNAGIYVNDIPGLDELSDNERQAKIRETKQKVCRGSNVANAILQGDQNYDDVVPTKDTVIDMCWYFKGMAQEKLGTTYQQGALTLPDPDGRLAKFIDGCGDIYPRDSSHLRPQQRQGGSQGRGIDALGAFPGGMNTVLFHPYVAENGERRLYVKFESAGAYGHLRTTNREVQRRPEQPLDKQMSDAHAKAFVSGGKDESLAETREGTVNLAVQAAYQAIYDAADDYRQILETGKQASKQNAKGKITAFSRVLSFTPFAPNYWDVQQQSSNVKKLLDALDQNVPRKNELRDVLLTWKQAMRDANYASDCLVRLGDEVVLRDDDMQTVQSNDPTDGDVDSDRALLGMYDLLLQRRNDQKVLLEGRKKDIPYVYYKKIVIRDKRGASQTFDNVITVDTQVKQFEPYIEPNSKVATGKINKGTNVLKNKYFEYTGDVTQVEMFAALNATGWNMHNLTRAVDLKKKD